MFIFGGDTGETPESLARKRAIAASMMDQNRTPRTIGEGISSFAGSIAGALLDRSASKKENRLRQESQERFGNIFGLPSGQPSQTAALPQQPPQGGNVYDAIQMAESGGDPTAVSPKGAGGLMQIMPPTGRDPGFGVPTIYDVAAEFGVQPPPPPEAGDEAMTAWLSDPANAEVNRRFGELFAGAMQDRYGAGTPEALAAYNAGPGAVDQYGGVPPYEETQNYVGKILEALNRSDQGGTSAPDGAVSMPQQGGVGGLDPQLLELLSDPYLSDGQRAVVQALVSQAITPPEQMTPYQQAQIELAERRLSQQGAGGAEEYGLNPIWGTDSEGNPQIVQLGKGGNAISPNLPEGFQPGKDAVRIDAGTETILLDPVTRNVIGRVPKDIRGAAREVVLGKGEGEVIVDAPRAIAQTESIISDIDALLEDPGLKLATGWGAYVPFNIPGFNAETRSRLDKLQGQAFLQAFESLKGGGQITEVEGQKAEQAIARLNTAQSYEEFRKALEEFKSSLAPALERQRSLTGGGPKTYNPETDEFE